MYVTFASQDKMAYVGLADEPSAGMVSKSIRLDQWADEADVDAMHSLILDFGADGRLVGIEVFDAHRVLPASLLADAKRI